MSKAAYYADRAWGAMSSMTTLVLILVFIFWSLIQRPSIEYSQTANVIHHVQPGSTVYMDSPISAKEMDKEGVKLYLSLSGKSGAVKYRLQTVEAQDMKPGTSAYPVYIPSYVQKGKYVYKVVAKYRLNVFRKAEVEMPSLTIIVE